MSEQQRDASILILQIIGAILIFVTAVLGFVTIVCMFGWEAPGLEPKCGDGSIKEMAFTVIGAAGALWGASMMKEGRK